MDKDRAAQLASLMAAQREASRATLPYSLARMHRQQNERQGDVKST